MSHLLTCHVRFIQRLKAQYNIISCGKSLMEHINVNTIVTAAYSQ